MSAPWIAVVVCLWVLFIALTLVVAGVLRKVAAALESLPAGGFSSRQMPMGPSLGSTLPPLEVRRADGSQMSLADLPGPFILAILTSHCSVCLTIADRLRAEPDTLASLDGVVVVTDTEGPERLGLGHPITVLVEPQNQVISALQLPGTPFVIAVSADGTVQAAQILAGPGQLVNLLDTVRPTRVETPHY